MKDKKKCSVEDCVQQVRYKGIYVCKDGSTKRIYGAFCQFHHRCKRAKSDANIVKYRFSKESRDKFINKQCARCGWDAAYCDRHRIDPSLGYIDGNVLILCPNCHRLETISQANGIMR